MGEGFLTRGYFFKDNRLLFLLLFSPNFCGGGWGQGCNGGDQVVIGRSPMPPPPISNVQLQNNISQSV